MRLKEPEFKPLSFSTTMRNPERIADFLNCIKPYDSFVLTNDLIDKICVDLISKKLYKPTIINSTEKYKKIYDSEDFLDYDTAKEIKELSPQSHKEHGFEKGWPSRFDTWYKLQMELGFIYYEFNKPINISKIGYKLIDSYSNKEFENNISSVFLNVLAKYQTNNPFRKNKNSNSPLVLLLNVIKLLKEDLTQNGKGINKKEIPFIICSPDNDYNKIYNIIIELRKKYGYKYSDEIVYEKCFELLGASKKDEKRFKINQITGELVDEFIRKMRITGIVSLRGNGQFLDFNNYEKDTIDYIIKNYTDYVDYSNKEKSEYFKYISEIDNNIIKEKNLYPTNTEEIKENTLIDWTKKDKSYIINELKITCNKNKSKDPVLKYIDKPIRFEFLISVILKQYFPKLKVIPNYKADDEGLPIFTASGGKPDIECYDLDNNSIFEVTLLAGRNQASNEIPAITRHLNELKNLSADKFVFSVFIAPVIHTDTIYMTTFTKHQYHLDIVPLNTNDFVDKIRKIKNIIEFVN